MSVVVPSKEKILKEGWFRKKGGKGHVNKTSITRRYFVLTDRYLDWYAAPVCCIFSYILYAKYFRFSKL
jgi:hypothetical protein